MTIIPVAEFLPDFPDVPSAGSDTVFNVIPETPISYSPLRSLQPYSSAISARCQGGLSAIDENANVRVFAGDVSKLYRIASGATAFSDVSKIGGYTTGADYVWSFEQFGRRIIATNYNDPPQSYVEGTSTVFSDMITSGLTSLKARYVASVGDFVVMANTTDGTYGTQPQRVHWSAINDPTNFPTPGTTAAANALSDFQDLVGNHGQIKGIIGNLGSASGAIFLERAIYRMNFAGMPTVFDFQPVQGAVGLLTQGGLAQYGGAAFYATEDGFKMFDGSNSQPIGKNKVDRFFYNDVDSSKLNRMSSTSDPSRGLIYFAYPKSGSNGLLNGLLIYSIPLQRWSATETDATRVEILLKSATFGVTLEGLDTFGTLDALPYSLDSEAWIGGRFRMSAFDENHKFGYFDGSYLQAKVDTSDYEPAQGRQSLVNYVRPLTDATDVTVSTGARDRIQDTVSFGDAASVDRNGLCPVRTRGRYHRQRIIIPAGSNWSNISGIDVEDVKPMGMF